MATVIRPWQDDDLPWFIALHRRLDPEADLVSLGAMVSDGPEPPATVRLVGLDGDQRVGVALLRPGIEIPILYLLVDPVHRHRGHARALFDAIEEHAAGGALGADPANDERSLDIARRWGFEEVVPTEPAGPWLVRQVNSA